MSRVLLSIDFLKVKNEIILPFDLNYQLSSFFYKIINDNKLHDSKGIKNFTFSNIFLEDYKPTKSGYKLINNNGYVIFSSSNENIIKKLLENIEINKFYDLNNIFFKIKECKVNNDKLIENNFFLCEFITPCCITKPGEKYEKYINPKENALEYVNYMKKNIKNRLGYLHDSLEIMIIDETVKSRLITVKNTKIKGYKYNFILRCDDKNLINELFYSGIGGKCSQGFGMFNILKSKKI